MPECKLGLNDRVLLEAQGRATKGKAIGLDDIKFHQYLLEPTCLVSYFILYGAQQTFVFYAFVSRFELQVPY